MKNTTKNIIKEILQDSKFIVLDSLEPKIDPDRDTITYSKELYSMIQELKTNSRLKNCKTEIKFLNLILDLIQKQKKYSSNFKLKSFYIKYYDPNSGDTVKGNLVSIINKLR